MAKPTPGEHLSDDTIFAGVLSRNATYRKDARSTLQGIGLYDDLGVIESAIRARDTAMGRPDGKFKNGNLIQGLTQSGRALTYILNHTNKQRQTKNFLLGSIPYRNQAHHILPCEVFSDKKWTQEHRNVVLQAPYNINNPDNIIYLPQCHGQKHLSSYHKLPDHSAGHNKYNGKLIKACQPIFDKVDEAVQKGECEESEDLRKEIYDMLKQVEKSYSKRLQITAIVQYASMSDI